MRHPREAVTNSRQRNLVNTYLGPQVRQHVHGCGDSGCHDAHELKLLALARGQVAHARVDGGEQPAIFHLPELGACLVQLLVHPSPGRRIQRLAFRQRPDHTQGQGKQAAVVSDLLEREKRGTYAVRGT